MISKLWLKWRLSLHYAQAFNNRRNVHNIVYYLHNVWCQDMDSLFSLFVFNIKWSAWKRPTEYVIIKKDWQKNLIMNRFFFTWIIWNNQEAKIAALPLIQQKILEMYEYQDLLMHHDVYNWIQMDCVELSYYKCEANMNRLYWFKC